jgi:DNA-binding transcriptional LysR family regulator
VLRSGEAERRQQDTRRHRGREHQAGGAPDALEPGQAGGAGRIGRTRSRVDVGGGHGCRIHGFTSASALIRNLEHELGTQLFHRIGRRIALTGAGRQMIEPARQVLRDLETTRATVESVKGLRTGRLEIAAMPSPAVQPLSTMIGTFLRHHPAMRVDVRAVPTAEAVAEQVRTGAVEIGLVGTATAMHSCDVQVHAVARQRFVVLAPPGGPLPQGRPVSLEDLAGLTAIVAPRGTRARQLLDELRDRGVPLRFGVEAAHREAVLPLVVQGTGVAVATEAWADLAQGAGALVLELDPREYLHISLLTRRAPLTPGAQGFLDSALR